MDLTELRMIANPVHLITETKRYKNKHTDPNSKLSEFLHEKYQGVYLSDLNLKEISKSIDTYINDILIQRIVNECITKLIEDIIEKNDKFDFCLPFE